MAEIQSFVLNILSELSSFLWGVPMVVLLFGTHLFLTLRTGGIQRHLGKAIKMTLNKSAAGGDISNFSALMVAMAATVGTGNIIGVGTAIALGGPGAVFAFGFVVIFGTVTAFAAYLYGITIVGPLKGSILGLIEPVVAAFASALILRQAFALSDIIGIIAILGGVMILSIYKGTKAAV